MKRRDLIRALATLAADHQVRMVVIEGGRHTKIEIGSARTVIPRHREINEITAQAIIRQIKEKLL